MNWKGMGSFGSSTKIRSSGSCAGLLRPPGPDLAMWRLRQTSVGRARLPWAQPTCLGPDLNTVLFSKKKIIIITKTQKQVFFFFFFSVFVSPGKSKITHGSQSQLFSLQSVLLFGGHVAFGSCVFWCPVQSCDFIEAVRAESWPLCLIWCLFPSFQK